MITMGIDLSLNGMIFQVPSKISSMEIRLIGLQPLGISAKQRLSLGLILLQQKHQLMANCWFGAGWFGIQKDALQ